MKRQPGILGLLLLVACVGSSGSAGTDPLDNNGTAPTPQTSATTTPTPTSIAKTEPTTTTTAPTTTTTTSATTTTEADIFAGAAVVVDHIETEEGWRYRVAVVPTGADPERSPGGCVDVAPPGQTNLTFDVLVENVIDDRSAPAVDFVLGSNLVGDGTVADFPPFSDEMREARTSLNLIEMSPLEPDTLCVLAGSSGSPGVEIPPGDHFRFRVKVGPVDESAMQEFVGGIRVFLRPGLGIDATFGTSVDSGEVLGEHDAIGD